MKRVALVVGGLIFGLAAAAGVARAGVQPAGAAQAATPGEPSGQQVVVVGIPGLRWDELSAAGTPNLWSLAQRSARGVLSTRSQTERTCPDAGWLTLGAGSRAAGLDSSCAHPARIEDWAALVRRNSGHLDGRVIGALGAALHSGGDCADHDQQSALALGPPVAGTGGPCPLRLLDAGSVRDAADATRVDQQLGLLLAQLRAVGTTTVIVAGVSEVGGGDVAHLHVLLAAGPDFPAGERLSSPSTGRSPYVQLVDLAPTVLSLLHVTPPSSMIGRAVRASGPTRALTADVTDLGDLDRRARAQRAAVVPVVACLVVALLALVLLAMRAPRSRRWVARAGVVVMAVPVSSSLAMLVPWWRAGPQVLALVAVSLAIAGAIAAAALTGPWRTRALGPAAVVAAITAGVIGLDLLTGARLQLDSVLGYSPYVAGRFVGLGNPGFAVFGTAAVLATALWVRPGRRAWRLVALMGIAAVALDGTPSWGDDLGGVLALVPAFVVVASLLATGRVPWPRLLVAGVAGAAAVAAFALLDYARGPGHRTHLGRFVEQVRDGTAGEVIHRKAQANLDLLTHSPFTLLVPLLVLGAVLLLLRPPATVGRALDAHPGARAGLLGVLVMSVVGGLVNDSGTAIPAVALLLAVPVAIEVGVSARDAGAAT